MNFSALSIRNPIPAIMLFALLTFAGILAFRANKVQDFPDIELPIVTVVATLDGAAPPLALGLSGDPSFRSPMAVAVIGGLITSTLLSLLVVPAVFTYVDDIEHWFGRQAKRLRRHSHPPVPSRETVVK